MTQRSNATAISALSFFLPFSLMSMIGLITQRTLLVLLILITGNLLGALWADRFGFKSLMMWSSGIGLGMIFFITQLKPPSSLKFLLEFNDDSPGWMFLSSTIAVVVLAFYKNFPSFKESLKAQSFFWASFAGIFLFLNVKMVIYCIPFFCFLLKKKIFTKLPVEAVSAPFAAGVAVTWVLLIRKFFPFIPICQDKEPFWNAIKGVFKKEYVLSGMAIGLLLGLIYFGAEPLWKKEWISKWSHPDGSSGGSRTSIGFALAAPALGALIGFIVTWIRCRLGEDSISEFTAAEKIQFARKVIVRTVIFVGSGHGLLRSGKALESIKSDLIALLKPLENKFIFSTEAVSYTGFGLLGVHLIIFSIVFYKLFARALIMYHYNLFQITHQAKNHGAFAAMTWVGFVASVAFLLQSIKRFLV